jgi:DNA-binding SARP family transcriptional activator
MRLGVLGPLLIRHEDSVIAVPATRQRTVLAVLLVNANRVVSADELADIAWDGAPPDAARVTVRGYIRRLRLLLGPAVGSRIATRSLGYVAEFEAAELDVLRFAELCRDGHAALQAGSWTQCSDALGEALGLWRDVPLSDVPCQRLQREVVPRLDQMRLHAAERRAEAELHLGHHDLLVPELQNLVAEQPLREHFHAQLMIALARCGRRAEALAAYQQVRRILVDELGIEPGPELRGIHQRILASDAAEMTKGDAAEMTKGADAIQPGEVPGMNATGALAGFARALAAEGPVRALGPAGPAPAGPAQLPADIADFTGREAQASYLSNALTRHEAADGPGTVRIVVIVGAAGLGKTTLAVHAAHRVRDLFPDGQLWVQLSGASGRPAVRSEVLARLLRDLGVDGDKVPAGEEERAALYRTRLAGRRVLILLDDAKDAAQVRPLLPGSASCAVVVTTRNRTPFLVSTRFVDLGMLPGPEALELFSRIVGDARPAAEPEATAHILRACAGLPLTIRICAARLATRPQWRIATMAARLRDERRRLDELQVGDLEVRASFQVSYDSLSGGRWKTDPARAFRLLGLWPGQRISLPAAAALTGEREADVAAALEALVDVNLLESPEPDWYQLHDLLRLFATERVQAEEAKEARLGAVTRLLQWYLATAAAAADVLAPYRYRIPSEALSAPGPPLGSAQDALAWYDHEHANVIAAIQQAAAAGLHDVAWRLPTALFPFFGRRHNWAYCITAHRIAVNSAHVSGSRLGRAWALHNLGWGLAELGGTEAFSCLQEASAIRQEMKDLGGEAQAAISLAGAHSMIHGPQAAYEHSLRYLELLRKAGNPALLGIGLNNHGQHCRELGKVDEAIECIQEALGIWRAIGGGNGHGQVLENLGRIHLESGRLPEAVASLSEAHRLCLAQGDLRGQAVALKYLGEAQRGAGRADQARESLEAALAVFKDLKATAEVEDIQPVLAELAQPADPAIRLR